jgi:hypothetical protein
MSKSPEQQAAEDNEVVQAAFERARAKLAAARSASAETQPGILSRLLYSLLCDRFFQAGLLFAFLGLFALLYTSVKELEDAAILAVCVGAAVWFLYRAFGGHGAYQAVRLFYGNALSRLRDAKVYSLSTSVVPADFDLSPRRPPAFNPEGALTTPIAESEDLDNYWNRLLVPEDGKRVSGGVKSIRLNELDDDLVLATAKVRLWREPAWVSQSFLLLIPVVVLVTLLASPSSEFEQTYFVLALLLALLVAALVPWLLRLGLHKLPAFQPRTFTVRKLVVRSGGRWQMFCGDWEGHEEAYLSWLDGVPPARASSTGSAV